MTMANEASRSGSGVSVKVAMQVRLVAEAGARRSFGRWPPVEKEASSAFHTQPDNEGVRGDRERGPEAPGEVAYGAPERGTRLVQGDGLVRMGCQVVAKPRRFVVLDRPISGWLLAEVGAKPSGDPDEALFPV